MAMKTKVFSVGVFASTLLFGIPAGGRTLTWNGGASGDWDTSTASWLAEGIPAVWDNGIPDEAIFTNSATVTLRDDIVSGEIIQNEKLNVVIQPSAAESLSPTRVQAGYKAALTVTAPLVPPAAGMTARVQSSGTLTLSGPISGSGPMTLDNNNVRPVILCGDNADWSGTVNMTYGSALLQVGHARALGTGNVNIRTAVLAFQPLHSGYVYGNHIELEPRTSSAGLTFAGEIPAVFTGSVSLVRYGDAGDATLAVNAGAQGTLDGTIKDTGSGDYIDIVKDGGGTLVLGGHNTYLGATTVSGGTLLVNGSCVKGSAVPGGVVVAGGARLGGTGSLDMASCWTCTVSQAALIAPGHAENRAGTFTILNGAFKMGEYAQYEWDHEAGTSDRIEVSGDLLLPSVATVRVNRVSGILPLRATIFSAGAVPDGDTSGWVVIGDAEPGATVTVNGTDVVLSGLIPPPGTLICIR